jgi:hypothetical protein
MRRLAFVLTAVLALAAAPSARAESLDIDLAKIGAPDANVWTALVSGVPGTWDPATLARESRQRFAILSTEMALALSSAVLHPAATTGHSGFAMDLEVASVAVHGGPVGGATPPGFTNAVWPTSSDPGQLFLPSIHVRKALPFSLEFGGRLVYLADSSYYAGQGEVKWALHEGFDKWPDVAVRAAYTRLLGQKDWRLGTTDLDLMISKRWTLNGVTALTPYVVARLAFVSASSGPIEFNQRPSTDPASNYSAPRDVSTEASFPSYSATVYRTTFGARLTASGFALALEGTYFGGASPSSSAYEGVKIASAFGGAAKVGWEF